MVKSTLLTIFFILLFSGCGGGENASNSNTSFHFQGRDCLSCHNIDLHESQNLTLGGTLYKSFDVNDSDNISEICNKKMNVHLVDDSGNIVIDTSLTQDKNSSGFFGTGNFFVLNRTLSSITGNYIVRIVDEQSNLLATSSLAHDFSSEFNKDTPSDTFNRYSCNSCHNQPAQGGAPGRLFANKNLCN